eukprot:4401043-Pleurochrysis_carterae.AAC.1
MVLVEICVLRRPGLRRRRQAPPGCRGMLRLGHEEAVTRISLAHRCGFSYDEYVYSCPEYLSVSLPSETCQDEFVICDQSRSLIDLLTFIKTWARFKCVHLRAIAYDDGLECQY